MAYKEPGVVVRQELANAGVVIQSADQDPVLVGELYEVLEDKVASTRYDATQGAGDQTFTWPGKKTNSIVDLAGVREDTAEPDSQLRESATFPFVVELQDPALLTKTVLDPVSDIKAVSQNGFTVVEGVDAAVARLSAGDGSAAEGNKIRSRAGGFINAGVKAGDRIRVVLQHTDGGPDVVRGVVSSVTDNEITYTSSDTPTVDAAVLSGSDGDAVTSSGRLFSAAGGFTTDVDEGDRIALWPEALEVDDGNGVTPNTISSATGLGLSAADVGRKVTIHSAIGAVTATDGAISGGNTMTATGVLATHVGRVVKISGGSTSLPATYRRIVSAADDTMTFSGTPIADATNLSVTIFKPEVRVVEGVTNEGEFTYGGPDLSDGAQVGLPIVLHRRVLRDVVRVESDSELSYSGSALTSDTGFLLGVPFDIFKADVSYQVFPDYQVLVTYRALDISMTKGLRVSSRDEVANLGTISKANPLLFAADRGLAAMGTNNRYLLLIGVNPWGHQENPTGLPGDRDPSAAFGNAISLLANDPGAYFVAPLTMSKTIGDAFVSHVNAKSGPLEKKERAVFLAYDVPQGAVESTTGGIEPGLGGGNKKILDFGKGFITEYGVIPGTPVVVVSPAAVAGTYEVHGDTTDDELVLAGDDWAKIEEFTVEDGDFDATAGRVSTATPDAWRSVDVGDWIVSGGQYRRVSAKVNNQTLAYEGAALSGAGATVSVIRSHLPPNEPVVYYVDPLSNAEKIDALRAISTSRANHRVVHCLGVPTFVTGTDQAGNDIEEEMEPFYLAAMEACRNAVLPPERSSTGTPLPGVVRVSGTNDVFDTAELNQIAESGWTIFEQPTPGGSVVCRHLMSTDVSSIKRREFSVTKNVDNQAKVIRKTLAPSLNDEQGRKNITPKLLDALMLPLQGVLKFFHGEDQLVVGPNGEAPFKIRRLYQDPEQIDQVCTEVETTQPTPANNIDVTYVI